MNLDNATITVLGLGHIGLPTAVGLAELGRKVVGADDDAAKVASIRSGQPSIYEPGLTELLSKHLASGSFELMADVGAAVRSGSIIFICVGTPQKASGQADLAQVEAVARVIARNLNGYKLIVEKSTVPAITAQWLRRAILRYYPGKGSDGGDARVRHRVESRVFTRGQGAGGFFPSRPHRVWGGFGTGVGGASEPVQSLAAAHSRNRNEYLGDDQTRC
jgi:UDP-N-acetyl-D-mannosaminuronate dehydrogenase